MNHTKKNQIDYRLAVIRKLTGSLVDTVVDTVVDNNSEVCDLLRLTGRHFLRKIPVPPECKKGKVQHTCKVCSVGEREFDRLNKLPKRKRAGHESSYECSHCKVALCVDICFELFHTQKNYIDKYIQIMR